jgi:HAD superfamily hydrolase (TIGR01509 family)
VHAGVLTCAHTRPPSPSANLSAPSIPNAAFSSSTVAIRSSVAVFPAALSVFALCRRYSSCSAHPTGMVKALLCDIDGTLVQSNWLHAESWQVAFGAIGIHLELEEIRRQIGKGGDELIPVFVPWWKREAVEEPLNAFRKEVLHQDYLHRITPLAHARDFLARCKQEGIRIALSTSAEKDELEFYKKLVGMEDLVDEETSATDADRAKPHPDIFQATLKRLGLKPTECIALGDTPYDAESAGKAGLRTIGVETGGWTKEELYTAGCVEVYSSVGELLQHFDESALVREGLRL